MKGIKSKTSNESNKRRMNLKETFMCYCPFPMLSSIIIYPGIYYFNPQIPSLLISIVPAPQRNFTMYTICLTLECLAYTVLLTNCVYMIQLILSFITTFTELADSTIYKFRYLNPFSKKNP